MKNFVTFLFVASSLFMSSEVLGQMEAKVDQVQKQKIIASITSMLNANYVFPKVAKDIEAHLNTRMESGAYDMESPQKFAEVLTNDMRHISHDLHLGIQWAPQMAKRMSQSAANDDGVSFRQRMEEIESLDNYGFKSVEYLSKGVGYLELTGFSGSPEAGEIASAAMNFLSKSKALIIDLRKNGGGSPTMIQILSSYLFDGDPVHLNSFYNRPTDETSQSWTLPYVPGTRMPDTKVYVLTSNRTFSAAEEFSYNLKNLERATLVGEITGGGAHPGGRRVIEKEYLMFVPDGRAINPITKTNWEGVGVAPNISTPADEALDKAHAMAVKAISKEYNGVLENPFLWTLEALEAEQGEYELPKEHFVEYSGHYGVRKILVENEDLIYQRDGRPPSKMIAMKKDLFAIEGVPHFRIRFVRENDEIIALEGMYDNGRIDRNDKDGPVKP